MTPASMLKDYQSCWQDATRRIFRRYLTNRCLSTLGVKCHQPVILEMVQVSMTIHGSAWYCRSRTNPIPYDIIRDVEIVSTLWDAERIEHAVEATAAGILTRDIETGRSRNMVALPLTMKINEGITSSLIWNVFLIYGDNQGKEKSLAHPRENFTILAFTCGGFVSTEITFHHKTRNVLLKQFTSWMVITSSLICYRVYGWQGNRFWGLWDCRVTEKRGILTHVWPALYSWRLASSLSGTMEMQSQIEMTIWHFKPQHLTVIYDIRDVMQGPNWISWLKMLRSLGLNMAHGLKNRDCLHGWSRNRRTQPGKSISVRYRYHGAFEQSPGLVSWAFATQTLRQVKTQENAGKSTESRASLS